MATASATQICNRGLQILGAARITSLTDDTRNARACNACYDILRQSELRKHLWNFAKKRVVLAPLVETDPLGEFSYVFKLPTGCLRIIRPADDPTCDWQVIADKLYTNSTSSLELRYIADITDPNLFDPSFCEMLSAKMASEMCEELTQSGNKKADAKDKYLDAKKEARLMNAFETIPAVPETDGWVLARR